MPCTTIVSRVRLKAPDIAPLSSYVGHVGAVLEAEKGFLGLSIWQSCDDPADALAIYEFRSEEVAHASIRSLVNDGTVSSAMEQLASPPDVIEVSVDAEDGANGVDVPIGGFASLTIRVAQPGMGGELDADLATTYGELESLEGYKGSVRGTRLNVDEEHVGLVFWDTETAFRNSLSFTIHPDVVLYRRVL